MVKIYITNDNKLAIYDFVSLLQENIHQQKIINRLSRKIQKKNVEINQLIIAVDSLKRCISIKENYNCELIDRIYKAIDHVENYLEELSGHYEYDELLKILKGGSNE